MLFFSMLFFSSQILISQSFTPSLYDPLGTICPTSIQVVKIKIQNDDLLNPLDLSVMHATISLEIIGANAIVFPTVIDSTSIISANQGKAIVVSTSANLTNIGTDSYKITLTINGISKTVNETVEVVGNKIVNSSGSNMQSVCKSSPISSVEYQIKGQSTLATIGWTPSTPQGLSFTKGTGLFAKTYTLSGTPIQDGIYSFTISASS